MSLCDRGNPVDVPPGAPRRDGLHAGIARIARPGVIALAVWAMSPVSATAQPIRDEEIPTSMPAVRFGEIADPRIVECSGVVRSPKYPGVFWVHNDGGNPAEMYAIDIHGQTLASFGVDAPNRDWEDIATDEAGRIYIADTGNNSRGREQVQVYVVDEPDPAGPGGRLNVRTTYLLDHVEPAFDCEALFIRDGHGYVISKHLDGTPAGLFGFDLAIPGRPQPLVRVATLPIRSPVTAADLRDDGKELAVQTVLGPVRFDVGDDLATLANAPSRRYLFIQPDMESVCFIDGGLLALTESRHMLRFDDAMFTASAGDIKATATPAADPPVGVGRPSPELAGTFIAAAATADATADVVADATAAATVAAVEPSQTPGRSEAAATGELAHSHHTSASTATEESPNAPAPGASGGTPAAFGGRDPSTLASTLQIAIPAVRESAFSIDGKLDEWARVPSIRLDGTPADMPPAGFWGAWSPESLLLAVYVPSPARGLKMPWFDHDCVEVFVGRDAPDRSADFEPGDDRLYVGFGINSDGSLGPAVTGFPRGTAPPGRYAAAAQPTPDGSGYTLEIRIPAEFVHADPLSGQTPLRLNVSILATAPKRNWYLSRSNAAGTWISPLTWAKATLAP